jgi:hypothetical protein
LLALWDELGEAVVGFRLTVVSRLPPVIEIDRNSAAIVEPQIELRRTHLDISVENEAPAAPVVARWRLGQSQLALHRDQEQNDSRSHR